LGTFKAFYFKKAIYSENIKKKYKYKTVPVLETKSYSDVHKFRFKKEIKQYF